MRRKAASIVCIVILLCGIVCTVTLKEKKGVIQLSSSETLVNHLVTRFGIEPNEAQKITHHMAAMSDWTASSDDSQIAISLLKRYSPYVQKRVLWDMASLYEHSDSGAEGPSSLVGIRAVAILARTGDNKALMLLIDSWEAAHKRLWATCLQNYGASSKRLMPLSDHADQLLGEISLCIQTVATYSVSDKIIHEYYLADDVVTGGERYMNEIRALAGHLRNRNSLAEFGVRKRAGFRTSH